MQTSVLVIFKIVISFAALFVLPFILVTVKIFHQQDKLFQIYISMVIGLFSSVALVYLLAIFNVFNKINFLISYGSVILFSNLYFFRQTKQPPKSFNLRLTPTLVLLFAFGIGSYMRLYDPLRHVSLGSGDFYWHLQYLKSTAAGRIFASYPRGYHIILTLIHFVSNINFYAIARFVGAFFGIISIGAVYCLMKHVFGKKAAIFATLFYSSSSLFSYLTIEETGFFPQGFGFVLVPFVICFALELINNFRESSSIRKRNILVFIFVVFLLSLITPYLMLQMTYILGLILFFSVVFHAGIRRSFKKVVALLILFSLGIGIVLLYHTTLAKFSNVSLKVRTYDETKIVESLKAEGPLWKVMTESVKSPDRIDTVWKTMEQTTKGTSVVHGKWEIMKTLLYIKRLRIPVSFPLSLGVYSGLLLSFFIVVFSIIKRRLELFTLSIFIFLFGVSCMTGILELPYHQGRSGWYFTLGSIWLGGIIVKRFYDQELMEDIFHTLKRVIPLRITNKARSIKKSNASLIYLILSLSALLSYLVIIWVFGLLRLNPIRDTSLLLLILIVIFIVSEKKRDILSGERIPYCFPEDAGLYLSLHKTLVLAVVLVTMLYPLSKPPEYNFRYYHRSINEDDFVKVVQKIKDEYPLSEVKMFFDNDIVRNARQKTKNMVYPRNIKIAGTEHILSGIGDKRYNFLFLDCRKEKSDFLKNVKEWVSICKEQHNNVRLFCNSENIAVYLIENHNVSDSNKN